MSFLSRLAGAPETELDRVVRNVAQVLGTRKEHGSPLASFGLGDYEGTGERSHGTREALTGLGQEILEQVERYEPRLGAPRVTWLGRDREGWLRFRLDGLVDGAPCRLSVCMHAASREVVVEAAP